MRIVVGRMVFDGKVEVVENLYLIIERIARSTGIVISGEEKVCLIHELWKNK